MSVPPLISSPELPCLLPNHQSSALSLCLSLSEPNLGKLEEIEEKSVVNPNLQFLPNSKKFPGMAVTHQQQPQEGQINGGAQPSIASTKPSAENTVSKRQRRPSVRLGEIGDQPAAALTKIGKVPNKVSRIRPLTNLSVFDGGEDRENIDNLAIGSWKIKGSKSKRPRTNWASRIDEGVGNNLDGQDGVVRDSENEQSPTHSVENEKDLNFRVRTSVGDDDGVELDGPSDNGGGQSARRWGRDDGVKVWLNGLGLGRYWPVFQIHEVDEEVLPLLTLEDLKDMGINAVGSRRKMFCAIQKLSEVFS